MPKSKQASPSHCSPAVAVGSISPSLLQLGRLSLDRQWILGPRSRLSTIPLWLSCLQLVLLQAQAASRIPRRAGSLGSFSDGKWCCFCAICSLASDFILFAPLWQDQLGNSSKISWAGSAGSVGKQARANADIWDLWTASESLQQKWLPLRDRMLICTWGMLTESTVVSYWVAVATFIFCQYNRQHFFKKCLHPWLLSPGLCGFAIVVN